GARASPTEHLGAADLRGGERRDRVRLRSRDALSGPEHRHLDAWLRGPAARTGARRAPPSERAARGRERASGRAGAHRHRGTQARPSQRGHDPRRPARTDRSEALAGAGCCWGASSPSRKRRGKVTEAVSPRRLRGLFVAFACATLLLSLRVGYWQTIGRGDLLEGATDQVRSDLILSAQRGVIRDRNGGLLATTVPLRSLYAIPKRIGDEPARESAAAKLAPLLGTTSDTVIAALDSG